MSAVDFFGYFGSRGAPVSHGWLEAFWEVSAMSSGSVNADQVKSIFGQAQEFAAPVLRAAYVEEACGGDAALRAEVERLLAAADEAGSFMAGPALATVLNTEAYRPLTEGPGTVIGPYKLMEQIGEGGFGLVFVAEQHQPVRRKVALKMIKPGMDTRDVIARFEAERQALALMDHPNIAKVFDAGATDSGRPYFVMELVRGVPITEYCDQQHLTPRERLELFVSVCHAIQHAHQKGHHPPRRETDQRAGHAARRPAGREGDRLRRGQGAQPAAHRADDLHAVRADDRHAALHEPRAGGDERPRHRHPQRHLFAGCAAVRAA